MLAIVCPGQGSQTPGFLAPWLELPSVAGQLASLSEIAGLDLTAHGTTSDEETIKDTAVAQPLIVAAGLVAAKSLFDVELSSLPVILAGHSVGEITASALAGVLTEQEAMTFVRERANSMAAAAAVTPTGMSAVVGGDPAEVLAAIEASGATPANVNGAGRRLPPGRLTNSRRWPRTRQPRPASFRSRWPGRSTPPTWLRQSVPLRPSSRP